MWECLSCKSTLLSNLAMTCSLTWTLCHQLITVIAINNFLNTICCCLKKKLTFFLHIINRYSKQNWRHLLPLATVHLIPWLLKGKASSQNSIQLQRLLPQEKKMWRGLLGKDWWCVLSRQYPLIEDFLFFLLTTCFKLYQYCQIEFYCKSILGVQMYLSLVDNNVYLGLTLINFLFVITIIFWWKDPSTA